MVAFLLDQGADVNHRDTCGRTALWLASWLDHADLVALLLKRGANVNLHCLRRWVHSPLAITANWDNVASMLHLLNHQGIDIEFKSHHGQTAIFTAIEVGQARALKLLLQYGADPTHISDEGWSPEEFLHEGWETSDRPDYGYAQCLDHLQVSREIAHPNKLEYSRL